MLMSRCSGFIEFRVESHGESRCRWKSFQRAKAERPIIKVKMATGSRMAMCLIMIPSQMSVIKKGLLAASSKSLMIKSAAHGKFTVFPLTGSDKRVRRFRDPLAGYI